VAKPTAYSFHSFFGHDHLSFDREEGQRELQERVNQLFARNGLVYELQESGQVVRAGPPVLHESLHSTTFSTGDSDLDAMLETARAKFLAPDPRIRRESLEKLWDAWERLKTLGPSSTRAERRYPPAEATAVIDKRAFECPLMLPGIPWYPNGRSVGRCAHVHNARRMSSCSETLCIECYAGRMHQRHHTKDMAWQPKDNFPPMCIPKPSRACRR
jgi:hypothetical protein